jgi:hypothetical protein
VSPYLRSFFQRLVPRRQTYGAYESTIKGDCVLHLSVRLAGRTVAYMMTPMMGMAPFRPLELRMLPENCSFDIGPFASAVDNPRNDHRWICQHLSLTLRFIHPPSGFVSAPLETPCCLGHGGDSNKHVLAVMIPHGDDSVLLRACKVTVVMDWARREDGGMCVNAARVERVHWEAFLLRACPLRWPACGPFPV